jgi:hypothetical protein
MKQRTKAEIDEIKSAIIGVLKADHPMTVRQVFYQLVVRALIEKTEKAYKNIVIRLLTRMRLSDDIPSHGLSMTAAAPDRREPSTASLTR